MARFSHVFIRPPGAARMATLTEPERTRISFNLGLAAPNRGDLAPLTRAPVSPNFIPTDVPSGHGASTAGPFRVFRLFGMMTPKGAAMPTTTTRDNDPVTPTADEAAALAALARFLADHGPDTIEIRPSRSDESSGAATLPPAAVAALRRVVAHLARGRSVMAVGLPTLLTTQQAADLLGVSRPHLVKRLLEPGVIPFTRTGNQRRVALADALAYRRRRDDERREALTAMTREAEALGLYDQEAAARAGVGR
jgi:excisionase family DNA binding protein